MQIHDFIINTLGEVRRAVVSTGESSSGPTKVELDFPVSVALTRSQPGEHSLEVPAELPTSSSVARCRISLTLER